MCPEAAFTLSTRCSLFVLQERNKNKKCSRAGDKPNPPTFRRESQGCKEKAQGTPLRCVPRYQVGSKAQDEKCGTEEHRHVLPGSRVEQVHILSLAPGLFDQNCSGSWRDQDHSRTRSGMAGVTADRDGRGGLTADLKRKARPSGKGRAESAWKRALQGKAIIGWIGSNLKVALLAPFPRTKARENEWITA